MTDLHASDPVAGESPTHHGPTFASYMIVFAILCVCTGISFIANSIFGIGNWKGVTIIMGVSIFKATLVAMFFMHLKYDWFKLYFIVFPVVILTIMMVIVLMPDTVLDWHADHVDYVEQPPHGSQSH